MNFFFVDRILELTPGQRTVALKHVTASDCYLTKNPAGQTHLVSCVMGEALGQLCSWNVIQASDFKFRLIGGIVGEVVMHDVAYLGETIILENTIDRLDLDNQMVSFHGVARVGDRIILEVKNGLGPLLPITDFGNEATVRRELSQLYNPGDIPTIAAGTTIERDIPIDDRHIGFDRILEWDKDKRVLAQKNVSLIAPYFDDHFSERPVLPLTILIESKLRLAEPFLKDIAGEDCEVVPIAVRKIKMNDFISPGSVLITEMKVKSQQQSQFVLSFRTSIDGRRICVCEAECRVA